MACYSHVKIKFKSSRNFTLHRLFYLLMCRKSDHFSSLSRYLRIPQWLVFWVIDWLTDWLAEGEWKKRDGWKKVQTLFILFTRQSLINYWDDTLSLTVNYGIDGRSRSVVASVVRIEASSRAAGKDAMLPKSWLTEFWWILRNGWGRDQNKVTD